MTTSAAQKRASAKYRKNNYHRVPLDLQHDDYEKLKAAAGAAGESINGFIKKAVFARIESEN